MENLITDDDVIHSGWLTKSPPQKKMKNAASWTNRYFRLCYVTKSVYKELKRHCTKEDIEEKEEENNPNENRLCLVFWKSESKTDKPFRAISLKNCQVKRLDSHPYFGNRFPNLLSLVTPTRAYYFSDKNSHSVQRWLEVLDESISLND